MKAVGVIPARFGSTRFPGKPLAILAGKPLLQWTYLNALKVQNLDQILIATDDDRIFNAAQSWGADVVMTDSDLQTGTDRIQQAVQKISADIVINIQGDEPLLNPKTVEQMVDVLKKDSSLEMVTLGHPLSPEDVLSLNSVKVLLNSRSEAIYFSRFPIPFSRMQAQDFSDTSFCLKHIGVYGFRSDFLQKFCQSPQSAIEKAESLEQLRALSLGARIKVIPVSGATQGVDAPEDLIKAEKLILGSLKD